MNAVMVWLKQNNPGRVDAFEKGGALYAKKILSNFNSYEFFTGESMNSDGM